MKRISGLIKLGIVVAFAINTGLTGILGTFWNELSKSPEYTPFATTTNQNEIQLREFLKERLRIAKEKERYCSEDYLIDYELYQKKAKELGFPEDEHHLGHPDATKYLCKLQLRLDWDDKVRLQKHFDAIRNRNCKDVDWQSFFNSLQSCYLSNFMFALLLFGIWYWERRKIPSPIYFLLMVVLYPITIPLVLKRRWSAEAEIRRRGENLFRSLSEEEVERIKRFSLGFLSAANFQDQIKGAPKHSYWLALMVTLVIAMVPAKIWSNGSKAMVVSFETTIVQLVDHLPRDHICDDEGGYQAEPIKIFWELLFFNPPPVRWTRIVERNFFRLKNIIFEIAHVPKFQAVSPWVAFSTNCLTC